MVWPWFGWMAASQPGWAERRAAESKALRPGLRPSRALGHCDKCGVFGSEMAVLKANYVLTLFFKSKYSQPARSQHAPVFSAIDYRAKFTKFTTSEEKQAKRGWRIRVLLLKILVLYSTLLNRCCFLPWRKWQGSLPQKRSSWQLLILLLFKKDFGSFNEYFLKIM